MDQHFVKAHHGITLLHPVGGALVLTLGIMMLLVPRRYAVWPMIAMACFVAPAQRITVFTLDFDLLRIMILFGVCRVFLRREWIGFRPIALDYALLAWAIAGTVTYTLLLGTAALTFKLGITYTAVGMYLLFRTLVRDWEDLRWVAVGFSVAAVPVLLAFLVERATGRNLFAVFGGVPETTVVRGGRLRCQGAFSHPILAGAFWAAALPLMASLWWRDAHQRRWGVAGVAAALGIIVLCASSTPVMATVFAGVAAAAFWFRHSLRSMRWAILLGLIVLHLVMAKPVWHLLARVDILSGSTGWHRYALIDAAVRHFDEWWLLGTGSTSHWGSGLYDVTNQYVLEGVRGGIVPMALFVAMVALAFRCVGVTWRRVAAHPARLYAAWAVGASLFVHAMTFFAVSYFGQINMLWYLTLAIAGSLYARATQPTIYVASRTTQAAVRPSLEGSEPAPAGFPATPAVSFGRTS